MKYCMSYNSLANEWNKYANVLTERFNGMT